MLDHLHVWQFDVNVAGSLTRNYTFKLKRDTLQKTISMRESLIIANYRLAF